MTSADKLLLIGWDGADWQTLRPLMAQGKLPILRGIVASGVSGDLRSFPPYLSPMLWNTIGTGHHPAEHGIIGFTEWNPDTRSIQPISSRSRNRKALWTIFSEQSLPAHVVGWFASHPAEPVNGVCISETFGRFTTKHPGPPAGSVFPKELSDTMGGCRVPPAEVERGLLRWFMPDMTPERLARDDRPQKLIKHLSELYSIHNAAIDIATHQPGGLLAVYFHFIDWICHDFAEYAAPQRPSVNDSDFQTFRHVLDRACELQDLLLGELLQALGPDTSVLLVSDHGFLSGDARPSRTPSITAGIAAWHRPTGILAASGPLFQSGGQPVSGATLFDITPTVLHAAGLPVGRDLPGHVLTAVARRPEPVTLIDSWETTHALRPLPVPEWGETAGRELLQQFQDLGYISTGDDPFENAADLTRRENAWNLGHALLQSNRLEEALACFESAWFQRPEQPHVAVPLTRCQARLGLLDEARSTLATIRDYSGDNPEVDLIVAELFLEIGDPAAALAHAQRIINITTARALARPLVGRALLILERWSDAESEARTWLAEEPANPLARLLLLRALYRSGQLPSARTVATTFLNDHPGNALAWFTLGQIELQAGQSAAAQTAHERARTLRPDLVSATVGLRRATEALRREQGDFVFCQRADLDFSDLPADRRAREEAARLTRLRNESRERFSVLSRERDAARATATPLALYTPPANTKPADARPIVIVSGLPRSGTSLVMQMLVAGGLPAKTDDHRPADAHNPRGFFEWEPVKKLHLHPARITEAAGHAVKVVSAQVPHLAPQLPLITIWIDRDLHEVVLSQESMILAREPSRILPPRPQRLALLAHHRDTVLARLTARGRPLHRIDHAELLGDPEKTAATLATFLGELLPHPERLAACVDPSLHRQKTVPA
jgi:predicted AlkP superfamily phosphohydrolase/phosphomutase/tetratricopeptide (TPR) repeat protein